MNNNFIRDTVVYKGISSYIPEDISSFTQTNKNEILIIDDNLPCIDEILNVTLHSNVTNTKLVKTGIGTSLEGQKLTGYKCLSEGEFVIRIDYCSENANEGIFTFKNTLYFNNSITLSDTSCLNSRVLGNVYVEDIYAQKISNREILMDISFIFIAESY